MPEPKLDSENVLVTLCEAKDIAVTGSPLPPLVNQEYSPNMLSDFAKKQQFTGSDSRVADLHPTARTC
jgi:hypothetical protein